MAITAHASGLPSCAEPPAGVPRLASYVDVKVPAKYWVDMTWQDGEWRPADHIPMPHRHATRLELSNVADFASLAAHRSKRLRFTIDIASRDIHKVPTETNGARRTAGGSSACAYLECDEANTVSRADRAKQRRIKLALVRIQDGFRIVGQAT